MKKKFKLRIGTSNYTVAQHADLHFEGRRAYGLTKFKEKEIDLESQLQKDLKVHTLLHEFFHAGLHEYGNIGMEPELEEQVVEALSHAFVASWIASKDFREAIKELK